MTTGDAGGLVEHRDEPWLYAIEDANGAWKDGEQCVFGDLASAEDEVDLLNDDLSSDSDECYKVVPLFRDDANLYQKLLAIRNAVRLAKQTGDEAGALQVVGEIVGE